MPNIRERLLIGATPKQVYAALTTEKGLSSWWTHNTKASPEQNTIAKFAFKPPYVKEMKIAELEPEKRVVWKCQRGADEWVGTTLSFDLEGGDKHSLLKMHPEMSDQVAQQPDNTPVTLLAFSQGLSFRATRHRPRRALSNIEQQIPAWRAQLYTAESAQRWAAD
jgi:uncharacterized protein YndB with AHSA1/START domain